jgi:hypothetical protein
MTPILRLKGSKKEILDSPISVSQAIASVCHHCVLNCRSYEITVQYFFNTSYEVMENMYYKQFPNIIHMENDHFQNY